MVQQPAGGALMRPSPPGGRGPYQLARQPCCRPARTQLSQCAVSTDAAIGRQRSPARRLGQKTAAAAAAASHRPGLSSKEECSAVRMPSTDATASTGAIRHVHR